MRKRFIMALLAMTLWVLSACGPAYAAPVFTENVHRYDAVIKSAVESYQKASPENVYWHKGRIMQESAFREDALSPVGAMGLCQFIKATAEWMNIDPWNPTSSIPGMVRYTNYIENYYASSSAEFSKASEIDRQMLIDAGYNWRMDRITRMARVYGWAWESLKWRMPMETRGYSPSIQKYKAQFADIDRHRRTLVVS